MFGPHTNYTYWMYLESPININDEGPIALWTSPKPSGPWEFKAFVLDGGDDGGWDSGRYSESRVSYFNGLWHIFATASPKGNPQPDKGVENIGWAFSSDGAHFEQYKSNPVVNINQSSPLSGAMAEGHVWFDEPAGLIYVYHTIRWSCWGCHDWRRGAVNAEDLSVEILSPSEVFHFTMPVITPAWRLTLGSGEESECVYDRAEDRYCPALKTVATSSSSSRVLRPSIAFTAGAVCQDGDGDVVAIVSVFEYLDRKELQPQRYLRRVELSGPCSGGQFEATTPFFTYDAIWIGATVKNGRSGKFGPLTGVTLTVSYDHKESRISPQHSWNPTNIDSRGTGNPKNWRDGWSCKTCNCTF